MDYDEIPSRIYRQEESFYSLLEAASAEARRISRAIQKIAGTTACKGVQINGLKKWAKEYIDTICLPSSDSYFDSYKSLSPNWRNG